MKRPIRPVGDYQEHDGYPSFESEDLNRRDFMKKAAATGAVATGVILLPTEARADRRDKDSRQKVSIYIGRIRLGKGTMSAQRIIVWTADKKLAGWLRKYSNRRGVTNTLTPILRKAKEDVLVDGKKLYRLERKLGAALTRYYKKKTGKTTKQPDLMMVVGRYWRPRMRGRIRRPIYRPKPRTP